MNVVLQERAIEFNALSGLSNMFTSLFSSAKNTIDDVQLNMAMTALDSAFNYLYNNVDTIKDEKTIDDLLKSFDQLLPILEEVITKADRLEVVDYSFKNHIETIDNLHTLTVRLKYSVLERQDKIKYGHDSFQLAQESSLSTIWDN